VVNKRSIVTIAALIVELILVALAAAALPALAAPQPPLRTVVVSEIAWMGTAASHNDEWIELYNNTTSDVSLTGWTLRAADGSPSISLQGVIPPGGYFLLERSDDDTVPGVPADLTYSGALGNEGEDLILRGGGSGVIDRVDCSKGWFAGHSEARVPMVRLDTAADGNLRTNWTHNPRCGTPTSAAAISHTCTVAVAHTGYPLETAVYFNERFTATTTTVDPTPMEEALIALIEGAQATLDVALYGLNRTRVVSALIAAQGRGVAVRVIGDDEAAADDGYSASYQTLTDAGIPVVLDAEGSPIQHNKFLVVDGRVVWTGSTNLTDTGLTLNANNSVAITSTTLAAVYTAEFEEMWGGDFHDDKADDTLHLLDYTGTRVESYFSPTDLVAFEVWDALAGADETVHFGMFFWTDDVLADRAVGRLAAGVEFYGVWDQLGAGHPASVDGRLCAAGAHIKTETFAGKLHHKFAVVDVEGSDPTVILGSYNWTGSGAYDNDENTLIIHDRDLARAYHAEWRRLWDALGEETLCTPHTVHLPIVIGAASSADPVR